MIEVTFSAETFADLITQVENFLKVSRPSDPKPQNKSKPKKSEPTSQIETEPGTAKLPTPASVSKAEVLAALKSLPINDATKIVRSYEVRTVAELKEEWFPQILETVKTIKAQL